MRHAFLICATLLASGQAAAAAPPARAGEYVMILVVTSGPADKGTGVSMLRQYFPSAEACDNAAKVMQGGIPGGAITAKCFATR